MLPEYARMAKVESGGRHLAMLFAIIDKDSDPVYFARCAILWKLECSYYVRKNEGFEVKKKMLKKNM